MLYQHITELIGNTPLLEIDPKVHGLKHISLYAKLEYFNPFGSLKDRIAWSMLKDEIPRLQKEKRTILEASSGNTGKALHILASVHGLRFKAFTNRARVQEVKDVLKLIGTDMEEIPRTTECPDPSQPDSVFTRIEKLLAYQPEKYFHTSQYTNQKNVEAHFGGTGREIFADIGKVDFFFGGLGTTGSTRGTAEFLKKKNKKMRVSGIVSSPDDFIPGIRSTEEMWEVGLFDKSLYDDILTVTSAEAIEATIGLIKGCGILAGPTSGATFAGTMALLRKADKKLKKPVKAVFIACDRLEWYVSYFRTRRPDLFGEQRAAEAVTPEEIHQAPGIPPEQAEDFIAQADPLILDIRNNTAYRSGHIKNSVNVDPEILEAQLLKSLPFSLGRDILVVCPLGEKSKRVVALLRLAGYEAKNLTGGIVGWRKAGKAILRF